MNLDFYHAVSFANQQSFDLFNTTGIVRDVEKVYILIRV